MPNRSLDDFAGGGEETEADDPDERATAESESESEDTVDETADADAEGAEPVSDEEPTLTVEEATPTYDFSPDGATCESCGETVETRWHDLEVGMVCGECKRWG